MPPPRLLFSAIWRQAVAGAALSLLASAAWGHHPYAQCKASGETRIQCKGGFSDGSGAPGVTMDVVSYDEKLLIHGKLGEDSTFTFKKPDGEFYILFDVGPGHVVEIDHTEVGS